MKCFQGLTWGISNKTLLTLYESLIRSKLDYGCTLYDDASSTTLNPLDSIQYRALSVVLSASKGTSLASLLAETGETSLHIRRQILRQKHMLKIKSNPFNITNNIKYKSNFNNKQTHNSPNIYLQKELSIEAKTEIKIITKETTCITNPTPWASLNPNIIIDLTFPDGTSLEKTIEDATFEIALKNNYPHHTQLFVDASNNQNNVMAIFIPKEGKTLTYQSHYPLSIYALEAFALLKALEIIESMNSKKYIIFSDNKSILYQLKNPLHILQAKAIRPLLINTIRDKITKKCSNILDTRTHPYYKTHYNR